MVSERRIRDEYGDDPPVSERVVEHHVVERGPAYGLGPIANPIAVVLAVVLVAFIVLLLVGAIG